MSDILSCSVALLLLIDVSGSIDDVEYSLQKDGYVNSLSSPELETIITKKDTPIVISIAEWAGSTEVVVPWVVINSKQDLVLLSSLYKSSNRKSVQNFTTNIAQALHTGVTYFSAVPCKPTQKVIDISGDGRDNQMGSNSVRLSVALAEENDITINGLPILTDESDLDSYYKKEVITQNGFIVIVNDFKDFARALIKKLLFELS